MQGSGINDIHLTANLQRNVPVKKILHRLRLTELWSVALFFGPPCRSVQSEKLSRAADRLPF